MSQILCRTAPRLVLLLMRAGMAMTAARAGFLNLGMATIELRA